ncbi:class I SAM-dependent methyltransferase [Pyruvatibacter sp.]|uniref:class I SAM-dependent DNA methyltransferase n=1 Tax=Pyruvatibacter sp. TaxID=1981328 RepID=UPI00326791E8
MNMNKSSDETTLDYYDTQAQTYAQKDHGAELPASFMRLVRALPSGGHVLDLGSGDGYFSIEFEARGFDVTATDGSAGLAAIASQHLKRPVRVERFDELTDVAAFDGVWAHASIHHAPLDALPDILTRIYRSLKPGGVFHMSVKTGKPAGRDKFDRFYCYPSRADIDAALAAAGDWQDTLFETTHRSGYDGVATDWIILFARKTA